MRVPCMSTSSRATRWISWTGLTYRRSSRRRGPAAAGRIDRERSPLVALLQQGEHPEADQIRGRLVPGERHQVDDAIEGVGGETVEQLLGERVDLVAERRDSCGDKRPLGDTPEPRMLVAVRVRDVGLVVGRQHLPGASSRRLR
jgi:hypothetical protein